MGHTLNLSKHGTVVETARVFPKGTKLNIEIIDNVNTSEDSSETITIKGTVVWASRSLGATQRGRMGIEFMNPEKTEKMYQSRYHN